jgi:hypothetical protein
MPYIIYVQVFILLSLFIFTLWIILPFILPTKVWNGKIAKNTQATKIPGQPKRVINIAIIPANTKGEANEANKRGDFVYIVLKSLDNKLIILPSYCVFAVYCDILDNLAYIKKINYDLILPTKIGT